MKNICSYLLLAFLGLSLTGCRDRIVTDEMSDSVKLEVLDLNLEKHPDDPELLAARARVLFNLQRLREASYDINRAVSLKPDKLEYLLLKSDISFANGDLETSYQTLEEAERRYADNQEVLLKMGEITFYSRDYDRSLKYLTNVTEREPNNRTALFMKGYIYKENGDTSNAAFFYRRLIDLYPDFAPAYEDLGVIYADHLDPLAIEYLNTAMNLDPKNENVIYAMAMFYQNIEDMEHADALYSKLLEINPQNKYAWHNRGWIQMMFYNDFELAVDYFTKALDIDDHYAEAHYDRGVAYELMGDMGKAETCYKAAKEAGYNK